MPKAAHPKRRKAAVTLTPALRAKLLALIQELKKI